ncbi:DegT/DnrJ/EryC1/StrS family aminotransferase [Hymenobacter sp. 5414T-23]|uniref:DegT/DnrJ/EryC1/StrS family aminotransferase n=1 Tax=Hymenobacter sp. 5414T-23 TaxID=2932252 RepID=UPI00293EF5A0|nr:DegT/DnrJ/EryC1/StrS family aminotransferase [Hymenobacter sp. 5414T-23]
MVTNSQEWAQKTRYWATQAKDPAPYYQHSDVGYNYRLSNLLAGIGRGQMELLEDRVKKRRETYLWYKINLQSVPGLTLSQTEPAGGRSNRWLTTLLLDPAQTATTPEQLRLHLESHNIESRPLWKPLHLQPLFATAPMYGGSACEELFAQGLCLPSGTAMTEADLQRIAEAIKAAVKPTATT